MHIFEDTPSVFCVFEDDSPSEHFARGRLVVDLPHRRLVVNTGHGCHLSSPFHLFPDRFIHTGTQGGNPRTIGRKA